MTHGKYDETYPADMNGNRSYVEDNFGDTSIVNQAPLCQGLLEPINHQPTRGNEVSVQTYKTTDQFIKEFKSFDDDKIKQLSADWSEAWNAAWNAARDAVWSEAWSAAWYAVWNAAWNAAWSVVWNETWNSAWFAAWSADLAVLVKDKITAEQFEILTSPWTSCGLSLFVEAEEVDPCPRHPEPNQVTKDAIEEARNRNDTR